MLNWQNFQNIVIIRVLLLELSDGKIVDEQVRHFEVSTETRLGPGENLFSFLAGCIKTFLEDVGSVTEFLNLGFTFSFPMIQERLDAARLVSWTKSFNCPGVEGEEVVGLLQKAIYDKSLNVRITKGKNQTNDDDS